MPAHADPTWFAFSNPLDRPWHLAGIELVVFACSALVVAYVARAWRAGDRAPAFRLAVVFVYGVIMELIAFNYWQNYDHAQFTIQLYHRLLPLYVPCVYVVLHVTGLEMVARLRLRALAEALVSGLAICLLDMPFDTVGVSAGWWTWSTHDHDVAVRWLGVPVTSYYWYLVFGAIMAALIRAARARFALAPLVAIGTVVLGVIAFLPFHAAKALGAREDAIVAVHLAVCGAIAIAARAPDAKPLAAPLRAVAIAFPAFHVAVLAWLAMRGSCTEIAAKFAFIALAGAGGVAIAFALPARRAAISPSETAPLRPAAGATAAPRSPRPRLRA